MGFEKIIGQQKQMEDFSLMIKENRVPHAMMILAPEGVGGLLAAQTIAQTLLCQKQSEGKMCGACKACLLSGKFAHPDLHYSFPVGKHSKYTRKATFSDHFIEEWRSFLSGNNCYASVNSWQVKIGSESSKLNMNVTECNQIISKLSLRSHGGLGKVLILWMPEFLGNNGNRLLKLIEEPPEDTFLIFVSQNAGSILPTILSRFQKFQFAPIEDQVLEEFLVNEKGIAPPKANDVANLAEGSISKAIEIIEGGEVVNMDRFISWFRIAYESNPEKLVKFINDFAKTNKSYQKQFYEFALLILDASLKFKYTGIFKGIDLSELEQENLKKMTNLLDIDKILKISSIINEVLRNMEQNINVRITMMTDTFSIGKILRA